MTQCGHYFGLHARTTIRRMNLSRFRRWLGVLVLLAGLGGGVPAWSQSRSLPDAPGTWKPWKPLSTTTGAGGAKEQAATPALVKAFEGELLALNAILRRATGVASPVGFSVETWGYLAGYHVSEHAPGQPAAGKLPIAGGLTFGAFPIFEYQRNGKTVREDTGETALQTVPDQSDRTRTDRPRQRGGLGFARHRCVSEAHAAGRDCGPAALRRRPDHRAGSRGAVDAAAAARRARSGGEGPAARGAGVRGERGGLLRLDWRSSAIPRTARSA